VLSFQVQLLEICRVEEVMHRPQSTWALFSLMLVENSNSS